MDRVANHWVDDRITSQRASARNASLSSVRELSLELIGTRADVRRRGGIMPSWVFLAMILLATLAVCVTVTLRMHVQSTAASQQYVKVAQDVNSLRQNNEALKREIRRLRGDASAIELAARTKLNMARPNEIIIPVE